MHQELRAKSRLRKLKEKNEERMKSRKKVISSTIQKTENGSDYKLFTCLLSFLSKTKSHYLNYNFYFSFLYVRPKLLVFPTSFFISSSLVTADPL